MADVLKIEQAAFGMQDAASLGKRGRNVVDAAKHQLEDHGVECTVEERQPGPFAFNDLDGKRRRLPRNT